jgi:hypothetical protein
VQHAFWIKPQDESLPAIKLMQSVEGDSSDTWPPSGPFQQIVKESVGTGKAPVLLAVGMAGKSHWSGTFEGDAFSEAIAMDFAVRVNQAPGFVGSTYWLDAVWKVDLQSVDSETQAEASVPLGRTVRIEHRLNAKVLLLESIGASRLSVRRIEEKGTIVTIHQRNDFESDKRVQTLRWRYVVRAV